MFGLCLVVFGALVCCILSAMICLPFTFGYVVVLCFALCCVLSLSCCVWSFGLLYSVCNDMFVIHPWLCCGTVLYQTSILFVAHHKYDLSIPSADSYATKLCIFNTVERSKTVFLLKLRYLSFNFRQVIF